ncbi:SDR family NAD(P)-dependent oxidoreductase [Thermomonas carbonis]|uniref:SDR family NAD(P)-dependent oxidoreductase n=1 Tax=Thermomonas carbonis TaxID=1463158 RepID=A0A7G9SPK2_9GAMM|nr:SDR family NAD(P)-dependent oxidoreductase [Thermomonas carbonis]QNN69777.1 SDR family NAD(P)-dependent oxidoreductase [Thermomonas carbonis]GHB95422.1 short-chain dehydrogenase [Thermomonas carbonis]
MRTPVNGLDVPAQVLVTGASSGIGLAMVEALLGNAAVARVCAVSRHAVASPGLHALARVHGARLHCIDADLTTDAGIDAVATGARSVTDALHLLVNCAGVLHGDALHPEKSLATLDRAALQQVFALNAFAPVLLVQALLPLLDARSRWVVASLSARVGSIGDNTLGGWYAYRASKAAQNQFLRTLAIELRRTHPLATCVLLHPGTVDTPLSRPFQSRVPAGALFTPARAAGQLLDIIAGLQPRDSGRFIAWDGSDIAW